MGKGKGDNGCPPKRGMSTWDKWIAKLPAPASDEDDLKYIQ